MGTVSSDSQHSTQCIPSTDDVAGAKQIQSMCAPVVGLLPHINPGLKVVWVSGKLITCIHTQVQAMQKRAEWVLEKAVRASQPQT